MILITIYIDKRHEKQLTPQKLMDMIAETDFKEKWIELNGAFKIFQRAWNEVAGKFLTPETIKLLTRMHREFEPRRQTLLQNRRALQQKYNGGAVPKYNPQTVAATADWKINPIPKDLLRRRVEITGPVNSTKMVIQMLSRNPDGHRADSAMLDFEDSMKPTWNNVMAGLENLVGASEGNLSHEENGKTYSLDPNDMPILMVRVRGLHLDECNITLDGCPISAGLFDFVLTSYFSARTLIDHEKTPKYYVPKTEDPMEARWWNDVFTAMEAELEIPIGAVKATFLIETLPAAFQMEEILYEIRNHAAGLNVGRWDKIFSDIKILRNHPDRILADRSHINLERPWMMNYAKRLIKICHAHGAMAIGGMSAFTPGKTPEQRADQTAKVVSDKKLEAAMGHDGCWVSHPYFIGHALSAFTKENQLGVLLPEFPKFPDLLPEAAGPKTLDGLRKNIRVGIAYLQGWNNGIGCVSWDGLMEDLATLEISRVQVWQWLHHDISLDDGIEVTRKLVKQIFKDEYERIIAEFTSSSRSITDVSFRHMLDEFAKARRDAEEIFTSEDFRDYLFLQSELA